MSPTTPNPDRRLAARQLARAKREAIARRARRIRVWVATATASLFLTAFLVVYVQLASGHDPALVANAERRSAGGEGAGGKPESHSSVEEPSVESEEPSTSEGSSAPTSEAEPESSGPSELRTAQS